MEVLLLDKVENLGTIGDRVKVKAGYGRNYLLPQGKATMATPENIKRFEAMRAELEQKAADQLVRAKARAQQLEALDLTVSAKAGTEGKLFGSIGTFDIVQACQEAGSQRPRQGDGGRTRIDRTHGSPGLAHWWAVPTSLRGPQARGNLGQAVANSPRTTVRQRREIAAALRASQ